MNQSRRRFCALLAASLSGLAGCGAGSGDSGESPTARPPSDENTPGGDPTDAPETPESTTAASQLVSERAETASVPDGAAVGLLPAPVSDALDEAIANPPAPTGLREDVELALEALDYVAYAEETHVVDARFVDGNVWYETDYEMHPTDEPDDEEAEMIIVDDLPKGERAAVVEAIETGSYTYDSVRDEHDVPQADVYRYEGEFYELGQVWHGEIGPTLGLMLEPAEPEDGDRGVTLEALDVGAAAAALFERVAVDGSVSLEGVDESVREATEAAVDSRELFTDGVEFYRIRATEPE